MNLVEAGKKGGSSLKHSWTDEERAIVRREYDGTNISAERIASRLGVTRCAVKGQVAHMGIAMDKSPCWTERELELLEQYIPRYSVRTIAQKLHRSQNAVAIKAKRLKLSLRNRDDWYTKMEVCEICGVDHKKAQKWIDSGSLKASYHNGHRPSQLGMAMWHIEANDLRSFIIGYSGELLGRNVDIQQIVWLLADPGEIA